MAAAPVRKEPAPPSATDRLAAAQAALAQATARIAELTEQRNASLLASDDDTTAIKLGAEIDALRQAARAHADKIELLKVEVAAAERARREEEREALIGRIEAKIKQRDAALEGAATAIKQLANASERAIKLNSEIVAQWTWPNHDLPPALLTPSSIMTAIAHECFRTSYHPRRYGGADRDPLAGISLPLSRAPTLQLLEDPARVRPMVDVVADASAFAKQFLRTGKGSAGVPTPNLEAATNGGVSINHTVIAAPQRSDAEQRLSDLLKQMSKLAEDGSPEGERRYLEVVSQVAQVQAEITAQQQVEAQHGR
jgi:hypothetical protein